MTPSIRFPSPSLPCFLRHSPPESSRSSTKVRVQAIRSRGAGGGLKRECGAASGAMSYSSSRWSASRQGGGGEYDGQDSPVPYRIGPLAYKPAVECGCKIKACRWVSWADEQPGRRYYICSKASVRTIQSAPPNPQLLGFCGVMKVVVVYSILLH
jgi:hypothetical protein